MSGLCNLVPSHVITPNVQIGTRHGLLLSHPLCEISALHERAGGHHGLEIAKFVGDHVASGLGGGVVDKIAQVWNVKYHGKDGGLGVPGSRGGHHERRRNAVQDRADSLDARWTPTARAFAPVPEEKLAFERREELNGGEYCLCDLDFRAPFPPCSASCSASLNRKRLHLRFVHFCSRLGLVRAF